MHQETRVDPLISCSSVSGSSRSRAADEWKYSNQMTAICCELLLLLWSREAAGRSTKETHRFLSKEMNNKHCFISLLSVTEPEVTLGRSFRGSTNERESIYAAFRCSSLGSLGFMSFKL